MAGLYFLLPTLLTIFISFLIVRSAAGALMLTGMDEKSARFQALSAFSGTGFTTREAESIVNHPLRRRIITWLMILGHAGIVTVIVTVTSSLVTSKGYELSLDILILVVGIYLIYRVATHARFVRRWESFIQLCPVRFLHMLNIEKRIKNWITRRKQWPVFLTKLKKI